MQKCVVTLKQLGYQSDLNASRTLEAIVARLPSNLPFKWAETAVEYMKQGKKPTFEDLARFIEERVDIMCTRYGELAVNLKSDKRVRNVVSYQPSSTKKNVFTLQHSPSSQRHERYLVCILCEDNHFLDQCPTLLSLEVDKRLDLIKEKRLCRLCLKTNHVAKDCRLRRGCTVEGCGGRHHTLLHVTTDVSLFNANVTTNYVSKSRAENEEPKVAFAVVPVILRNRDRTVETLAFLDSGSDSTLILKDVVDDLKLPMEYARVRIETMNGYREMRTNAVQLEVSSYESDESIRIKRAYVVPSLPKIKRVVPEEKQLRLFYQQDLLEESQSKDKDLSIEDRTALRIMEKSITLKDCHYYISLPWKDSQLAWTDNKSYCLHHKDLYPTKNQPTFLNRFEAVNSWMKLQRMIAWLMRYKYFLMNKLTNQQYLTVAELRSAELSIIRLAQKECFNDVFKLLNHVSVMTNGSQEAFRIIEI
ncbi:Gag-Pol polyprotein [Schistosoma japonicum]|nr:Gag-Pol polyprotein [Schistosoma japonicum]